MSVASIDTPKAEWFYGCTILFGRRSGQPWVLKRDVAELDDRVPDASCGDGKNSGDDHDEHEKDDRE